MFAAVKKRLNTQYFPGVGFSEVSLLAPSLLWSSRLLLAHRLPGLEENVEVCIFYVESWLRGNGCIPVNFKMEDAATAEISRAQVRVPSPLSEASEARFKF